MLRIAMLSYHTCPLATLGGKDTGGMNVYVRDLTRQLGRMGVHVDVFTRSQDEHVPHVLHDLGFGNRVVHIPAGPEVPLPKPELVDHISDFVDGIIPDYYIEEHLLELVPFGNYNDPILAKALEDITGIAPTLKKSIQPGIEFTLLPTPRIRIPERIMDWPKKPGKRVLF